MPGPFVPLVAGVHILMVAANGPPTVDIQATCETSINSVVSLGGTYSETLKSCMDQQNNALQQITKNWATYPAAAKAHCVQPGVYMPSYIEWLTCFEMELDVAKLRKEDATTAQANATPQRRGSSGSRTGSEATRCPIVQFLPDGSIASVINCKMPGY
jgi:hypothetical protein